LTKDFLGDKAALASSTIFLANQIVLNHDDDDEYGKTRSVVESRAFPVVYRWLLWVLLIDMI
jgi:hypothetical protein